MAEFNTPIRYETPHNSPPEEIEQFFQPPLLIEPPSEQEEWERIRNYFTKDTFYEIHDYLRKLPLPQQPPFPYYISRLMGREHQQPSEEEFALLEQTFHDEVFDESAYDTGLHMLHEGISTLEEQIFPVMNGHQARLGFYLPPHGYRVTLSRFGTNGSYRVQSRENDMQSEITLLFTGTENSQLLLERLVHEMTHIGLAQRLIRAGDFGHDRKESTIDGYVVAHFGHVFPEYERQGPNILRREKFQGLLEAVLYLSVLEGIPIPEIPNGDSRRINELLTEHSDLWFGPSQSRTSRHREDAPAVNQVLPEHGWKR